MLNLTPIPLLKDNYAYFLEDTQSGYTAIIDPSTCAPVEAFLKKHSKPLHFILNTHHHWDHVNGNEALATQTGAQVAGFEGDRGRIPAQRLFLKDDDVFELGSIRFKIMHIPGHTLGHVAYWCEEHEVLFTGDTLFNLGCGRLFEGTASQMWDSLMKLACLPDKTQIYCGHEYLLENLAFAKSLYPNDAALWALETFFQHMRALNKPTVGQPLSFEKRFNPFLRCAYESNDPLSLFTQRRSQKDTFHV